MYVCQCAVVGASVQCCCRCISYRSLYVWSQCAVVGASVTEVWMYGVLYGQCAVVGASVTDVCCRCISYRMYGQCAVVGASVTEVWMYGQCAVVGASVTEVWMYGYSVLLKICHFLKSRSIDIRNTARDTLVKVIQSLGPSYFLYILKEMRSTLKRGYQVRTDSKC